MRVEVGTLMAMPRQYTVKRQTDTTGQNTHVEGGPRPLMHFPSHPIVVMCLVQEQTATLQSVNAYSIHKIPMRSRPQKWTFRYVVGFS